ncbi:hypothetical protein R2571_007054 [Pseudomonas aeruginosa]|nr:hypothetical protein [Pseudomonas aeruginosa]
MTELSKIESLHKSRLNLADLDNARVLTAEDTYNLPATTLYEIVMTQWIKCSPCAQASLIKHKSRAVRDAAVFFASLHDPLSFAVA